MSLLLYTKITSECLNCLECWAYKYFPSPPHNKRYVSSWCVEKKNQLDATEWFIALIICSTSFRALLCPSSGARDYMCVITAYGVHCLVACCRGSGAGQQAMCPGRGMLHIVQHPSSWTHSLVPRTWPLTTSNQAVHTIGGNNTHIVSSSWWWA